MTTTLGKMNEIPESASSSSHLIDDDEFDSEFYDLLVKEDAVKKSEQYGGQLITFSKNKQRKFERDLHTKVKMELNPTIFHEFNSSNIPKLMGDKKKQRENTFNNNINNTDCYEFSGQLSEIMHKTENDEVSFYYTLKGNTQCIFVFPDDFRLYDHYVYSFWAKNSNKQFRSYSQFEVVVNKRHPMIASANSWSPITFKSLLQKCNSDLCVINKSIGNLEETLTLHPDAYEIPDDMKHLSFFEKYFYHIRRYIPELYRNDFESLKDFKFFFFNNEMQNLFQTWVPSLESLQGMKIDLLFVLYHLFKENGDVEIKKKYFNYLFFRPKKVFINIFDNVYKISEFFLCKSKKYEWQFPLYSILDKTFIANAVFSKIRKPTALNDEYKILMQIHRRRRNHDTCIYLSEISNELMIENLDEDYILSNLKNLKSIMVVPNERKRDKMIVPWNFEQYTEMLKLGLCNILNNFIIYHEEFLARRFDKFHDNSDETYRSQYENMELCGKQELGFYYAQKLPITFIDGEAGRGKTAVEGKIAQYFDRNEVLYLSSQNTTVSSVGSQKVCKRSLTITRLLVLHDGCCLNTTNASHHKHILCKLSNFKNPKDPTQYTLDFQSESIYFRKKYYNEQFECCYNGCILEDIKCVFIDESSLLDIINACRIFYLISMCCHPTVRVVIAGDGGQLSSISAGMVHKDFQKIFEPWMVKLDIDHRFKGDSSLKNISNNEAIRKGKFEDIHIDVRTNFEPNSMTTYVPDKIKIDENVRMHLIEVNEINFFQDKGNDIIRKLKPTLDYLINSPYYLKNVANIGETMDIQICTRTNEVKDLINRYITDTIFVPKIPRGRPVNTISHLDGIKVDIFKGMKVIYRRNLYDKIKLCNNLLYIVAKIQDVKFPSKKGKKDKDEVVRPEDEAEDDIISEEPDDSYLLSSGGSLSVDRTAKNILEDYKMYANPEFVIPGHEDLYATHYFGPLGHNRGTWGRRVIVVPATDVDPKTGKVKTYANQRIIPWNRFHWQYVSRASVTTIFGSQGREFEKIVLICPYFYQEADSNEMLYVGTTRSKTTVTLVITENILKNIVQNFQRKRKSHFPSFMMPVLKRYYDNYLLKVSDKIPEYILQKLREDEEKIRIRNQKIEEFRKKQNPSLLPSLVYIPPPASSSNEECKIDKEEEQKMLALMARQAVASTANRRNAIIQRKRQKEKDFPKDNNDIDKYEPIQKKQQPTMKDVPHDIIPKIIEEPIIQRNYITKPDMNQKRR